MEQTNVQVKRQSEKGNKQNTVAYILRLITPIILFLVIYALIIKFFIMADVYNEFNPLNELSISNYFNKELSTIILYIVVSVIDILALIFALMGKKHKWANIISIVFGFITATIVFIGVFSIVGGFMGKANLQNPENSADAVNSQNL